MKNLDQHLNSYLNAGTEKTASDSSINDDLISKIAAELNAGGEDVIVGQQEGAKDQQEAAAQAAMKANGGESTPEGAVVPEAGVQANAETNSVAEGASAGSQAAMDSKTNNAVATSGGNVAEQAAGSTPTQTMPGSAGQDDVSTGEGTGVATSKTTMHKAPESAAAAQMEQAIANMDEKTASEVDAMGYKLAQSFMNHIKEANQQEEAMQAVSLLKEAGVLDNYDLGDEFEKTASAYDNYEFGSTLEKIASGELTEISANDAIVAAAELQKIAADVEVIENQAEIDAVNDYQDYVEKVAEIDAVNDYQDYVEKVAAEQASSEGKISASDLTKLKEDPAFIALLKKHNMIKE